MVTAQDASTATTQTATTQTASTTDIVASTGDGVPTGDPAGTSTTGAETGESTAPSDAPPSILSFTVNDSVAPFEVGTPGYVTLSAVAEDDVGLLEVRFFDGDELLGVVAGASPHVFEWRVDSAMNGLHMLRAVAVDTSMQSADSSEIGLNIFMFGGQEVWVQKFAGGAAQEIGLDEHGNVYVAGQTEYYAPAQRWVRKYTPEGSLAWDVAPGDVANWFLEGFAVGAGAIYLTGSHSDPDYAWITRLDGAGALEWSIEDDTVFRFKEVFVSPLGHSITRGEGVGTQIVIKQHSAEGGFISDILGPKNSELGGMAVDASGWIYVSMRVMGEDVFVQKYDPGGTLIWTRLLESEADVPVTPSTLVLNPVRETLGVVCFELGGVPYFAELSTSGEALRPIELAAGWVEAADPGGGWLARSSDPSVVDVVRRYSHDFTLLWEFEAASEAVHAIATDAIGNVYAAGWDDPDNGVIRKLVP